MPAILNDELWAGPGPVTDEDLREEQYRRLASDWYSKISHPVLRWHSMSCSCWQCRVADFKACYFGLANLPVEGI